MSLLRIFYHVKAPLVALAFCALMAQQMLGFVLTASPAMADELGFSLCITSEPISDDPASDMTFAGAAFCPCTMQMVAGILPTSGTADPVALTDTHVFPLAAFLRANGELTTGPPPARAPPFTLHTA